MIVVSLWKMKLPDEGINEVRPKITYHQLQESTIEIMGYFKINITIEFYQRTTAIYSIKGDDSWSIIGLVRGKLNIDRPQIVSFEIQTIPIKYGIVKIPQVSLTTLNGENIKTIDIGESQSIMVISKRLNPGIGKFTY